MGLPNTPGSRYDAGCAVNASGTFVFFGGRGRDSAGNSGFENDLWYFDPVQNQWAWMYGSNTRNAAGVYGVKGMPNPANYPGARQAMVLAIDSSNNYWIHSGVETGGKLSDMWKFDGTNWTWMAGLSSTEDQGVYGTQGTYAAANMPGSRAWAVGWIDNSGNPWIWGGLGRDSVSATGDLNDLWKFNPSTAQWVWMTGSTLAYPAGTYGTQGVPAAANTPSGRDAPVVWKDSAGAFWFFGGTTDNSVANFANDLWTYIPQ